eukprot:m.20621 g.20621  ORF g.20621 m.20621 type:complete len:130 (-) comp6901_c0_seq1:673-1062(-)
MSTSPLATRKHPGLRNVPSDSNLNQCKPCDNKAKLEIRRSSAPNVADKANATTLVDTTTTEVSPIRIPAAVRRQLPAGSKVAKLSDGTYRVIGLQKERRRPMRCKMENGVVLAEVTHGTWVPVQALNSR